MYFRHFLAELTDAKKPLSYSKLTNLSSLAGDELQLLRAEWSQIDAARRRQVMHHLVELAEDNPELDFDEAFRAGLNDPDADVRATAVEGLWDSTDRTFIEPLANLLRHDAVAVVREAAAQALGQFMLAAELHHLRPRDAARIESALLAAIADEAETLTVRRRAVEAVSASSQPAIAAVIEDAYRSPDARMRASAIYAMGHNCDPRWLPQLLQEMESEDPEMRFEAAGAAGEMGDAQAVPALVRLLEDDDAQVQSAAITALGEIGGTIAKQALQGLLRHPVERVRLAAEEALEELRLIEDPLTLGFGD